MIQLPSRYRDIITEFDPDTNYIKSNSKYIRYGYNDDGVIEFIDPEGGPFLSKGDKLYGKTIKRFIEAGEFGFKVEFENE